MQLTPNSMWEAWGRTNALYTAWCTGAGHNPYRMLVLYAIDEHEPITQKSIADRTGLSKQTVSTVMRPLRDEGYVTLSTVETDRREKRVEFTQKGREYACELLSPLYEIERRVFEAVGAERVKRMSEAIELFNTAFENEMESQASE